MRIRGDRTLRARRSGTAVSPAAHEAHRAHSRAPAGTPAVSTTIDVRSGDAPQLEALLAQRIYDYNAAATGCDDGESFSAARTDASGDVEAGVCGWTWCGCCYVTYLWVAESIRGTGVGTELLDAVERHAREQGCSIVVLA